MVLIGAVCGAGMALGALVLALGLRGTEDAPARRPSRPPLATQPLALVPVLAFVAALAVYLLTGWVVGAAMAALLAATLPRSWRRGRDQLALVERTEAIAAWTEMLRDTLAAAAGLEQSIVSTAPHAPEAIRGEIARLVRRLERGERLVHSLRLLADDLANPAADLVVAALVIAAEREARDLVPLLTSLAKSTREEAQMRLHVRASRARLRTTVRVVVGSLAVFASGLILFNPVYLAPYRTVQGQLVLLLVGAILLTGYVMLQRMARIRTPQRFLTNAAVGAMSEVDR